MRTFGFGMALAAMLPTIATTSAQNLIEVKVGWCAGPITAAAAPYAIAEKLGWWYRQAGIHVDLVPFPNGPTDCMKALEDGTLSYALTSPASLLAPRAKGLKIKIFYTVNQGNNIGVAVPVDSPVRTFAELKGKRIGVLAVNDADSPNTLVRARAAESGFDPSREPTRVAAPLGKETAERVRSGDLAGLAYLDTQLGAFEGFGLKLRLLSDSDHYRFPSSALVTLESTLKDNRAEAIAVAQGLAKGAIFSFANPQAAIAIYEETYPQLKPKDQDRAAWFADDLRLLSARLPQLRLEASGVKFWGESGEPSYQALFDFMTTYNGVPKTNAKDVFTNDLIPASNKFDAGEVIKAAKNYK